MLIKVHDWVDASLITRVSVLTKLNDDTSRIYYVTVNVRDMPSSFILPTEYATWEEACDARDAFAESVNAALKSPA